MRPRSRSIRCGVSMECSELERPRQGPGPLAGKENDHNPGNKSYEDNWGRRVGGGVRARWCSVIEALGLPYNSGGDASLHRDPHRHRLVPILACHRAR